MCDIHSWYSTIFRKFVLTWLLGVIISELVLCSTHDVHRIVFKTHQRKNRDRENYKYRSTHRPIRKPAAHTVKTGEWPAETIKTTHQYYVYRPSYKNESYNNVNRHGKSRNYTTVKMPMLNATGDEYTTMYSAKLSIPIIESIYQNYHPLNNTLDLHSSIGSKEDLKHSNVSGNVRQLRQQGNFKNISKGYEVYEEIIGDVSPPPTHNLLLNIVQNLPVVTTTIAAITHQDEEKHMKENVSDYHESNINIPAERTKLRRNRGNVKFE